MSTVTPAYYKTLLEYCKWLILQVQIITSMLTYIK